MPATRRHARRRQCAARPATRRQFAQAQYDVGARRRDFNSSSSPSNRTAVVVPCTNTRPATPVARPAAHSRRCEEHTHPDRRTQHESRPRGAACGMPPIAKRRWPRRQQHAAARLRSLSDTQAGGRCADAAARPAGCRSVRPACQPSSSAASAAGLDPAILSRLQTQAAVALHTSGHLHHASSEWPPRSKKLSSARTDSTPISSRQAPRGNTARPRRQRVDRIGTATAPCGQLAVRRTQRRRHFDMPAASPAALVRRRRRKRAASPAGSSGDATYSTRRACSAPKRLTPRRPLHRHASARPLRFRRARSGSRES